MTRLTFFYADNGIKSIFLFPLFHYLVLISCTYSISVNHQLLYTQIGSTQTTDHSNLQGHPTDVPQNEQVYLAEN